MISKTRTILVIVFLFVTMFSRIYISTFCIYNLDEFKHVTIAAISMMPNGSYVGVSADLYTRVVCPGRGHVYVETLPLSQIDLQASTRIAALVASHIAGIDFNSCDFYASIKADSPIVGGPSASGVTAVAFAASLIKMPLNDSIVMTGMIMPDGSLGPVGGIKYKLDAAYERGAKMFIVPYGQTIDYVYKVITERVGPFVISRTVTEVVNLSEYGAKIGVKVIPVTNIYEALKIFTDGRYKIDMNITHISTINNLYSIIKPAVIKWIGRLKTEIDISMNRSKEIEKTVFEYLRTRSTSYLIRYNILDILNNIDNNINNLYREAYNAEVKGSVYSAASIYFQILIYAYTRLYLLNTILDTNFVNNFSSSLNKLVNELMDEIHNQPIFSKLSFSIAINVLDRLYETIVYINRSLESNDIISAAETLAYASARFYTAKLWKELIDIENVENFDHNTIELENIKNMSLYMSTLAQNIYTYIISFSTNTQLPVVFDEARIRYDLLQKINNDLDKIALSISSISYMYLTLVSMFTRSIDSTLYTLNRTMHINLNMLSEFIPLDAPLYIEFIKHLENDRNSQIIMLAKLSMILTLYRSIALISKHTSTHSTTNIITHSVTPASNVLHTITVTVTRTVTISITEKNYNQTLPETHTHTVIVHTISDPMTLTIIVFMICIISIILVYLVKFVNKKIKITI